MKTKKILAVSSALMIGTTTALTGFPAVVLAQENMQEAVTSEQEEKYTKVSVKIFTDYTAFLARAESMQHMAETNRPDTKKKEEGIRHLLFQISL